VRTIVTGSSGFIGGHLVKALLERGDEVLTFDKRASGLQDLAVHDLRYQVEDEPPADVLFHLASTCSTLGSIHRPHETFRDTVMTAINVIEYAREFRIPVILTSSVKARDGMTPYGAAKQMVETWALETTRTYGSTIVINRPGTVYGPGQEGSLESGWIAWFLKAKREGLPVTINGSGSQRRDLLHVSDYIRLMLLQADAPKAYAAVDWETGDASIWDVGGGLANTIGVLEMARLLGLEVSFGPARYGDAGEYIGINDVPGWKPQVLWWGSEVFDEHR
jgi:nucleoside-diphosphate-sugar epimerase